MTCFFAEGTLAKGCVVCLEKSGEVVYQMIPRVNGTAKGVIRTEFSVDCYNISVMDWEEDGSMGLLSVPVSGVWNDEQCTIPVAASGGLYLRRGGWTRSLFHFSSCPKLRYTEHGSSPTACCHDSGLVGGCHCISGVCLGLFGGVSQCVCQEDNQE